MNQAQVYKSNALVEASYRLTPAEQRIMLCCISQVRRDQPLTDEIMYRVSVADYAELIGTDSHSTYKELADAALRLKRREVWLRERPNGDGKYSRTLITGWVQSITYIKSEGYIELRFTKDMLPYLTQLTEQFTRYALSDIAKMTSSHGIRLYELLCQWHNVGHREVSIEWLRELFQLDGKYPVLKDFKKRVIEIAVEQINEHSPLWVSWEQRKTGRKVTHFIFNFGEKNKNRVDENINFSPSHKFKMNKDMEGSIYGIPMKTICLRAHPGESYEDVALRLIYQAKTNRNH